MEQVIFFLSVSNIMVVDAESVTPREPSTVKYLAIPYQIT